LAYSIEQSCLEADLLLSALAPGDVSSVGHLASSSWLLQRGCEFSSFMDIQLSSSMRGSVLP
jgi:hypothetical protein